jgi:hypothetical protein
MSRPEKFYNRPPAVLTWINEMARVGRGLAVGSSGTRRRKQTPWPRAASGRLPAAGFRFAVRAHRHLRGFLVQACAQG